MLPVPRRLTSPTAASKIADPVRSVAVFERLRIDYCCNGKRPIGQACLSAPHSCA